MLRHKDEELHHRKGPSPAPNHSQRDDCMVDDRNKKRERRPPHPHGERKHSLHRERTVSSFVVFDKKKLICLVKFYLSDFLGTNILTLGFQLQNYIFDIRSNDLFLKIQGVGEFAEKLVKTWKHKIYPVVYLLVKLVLTISVATATVKRSFSTMKYIKNELRN